MEKTELLLDQAGALLRESQEKQAASGEAFNLFSIAKIERVEVNTHSAMIAELLNPKGRHGKGPRFLEIFLTLMGVEHAPLLAEARVQKEQTFAAAQGRVDIVIHLADLLIFIENKIDAEDGDEQLKRYADAGKASGKKWLLWYLTLQGDDADERSCKGVAYRRVSYREHVLTWLEECAVSVADTPALQHGLIQYRNVVRKITGQSMTQNTRRTLIELLARGDNFTAADEIAKALPFAKGAVLHRFLKAIDERMSQSFARALPPAGFPGFEFDEETCSRWFMAKKRKASHVGMFFNIGIPGALFRIEVATAALHYGLVPVTSGQLGSVEAMRECDLPIPEHLRYQDWKAFKWLSCLHKDNLATNMHDLVDPEELLSQALQCIEQVTSGGRSQDSACGGV